MNVIIFGPPLAGKGTQSKKLIDNYNLIHLSTGDVLRQEKQLKTALGLEASVFSNKGLYAPDNLVNKIVEKFYQSQENKKNFLFDGYPRTIEQTKHLISFLEKDNNHIDFIIHLKVPKEVLLERAKIRAIEENRKDDENQNTVLTRINEFLTLTLPAIDYINKETKIISIEVDGNQSREEIYKKITKSLD
jgi:adenylate kinase